MELSIIIPAYDESKKISLDVTAAFKFLKDYHLTGEIIVVDDGSQDDTVVAAGKAGGTTRIPVNVIRYEKHKGKGFAIRTGIKASQGRYVMFADSGLCVPYENTHLGLEILKSGAYQIAHGSRKLKESTILRPQPLIRKVIGTVIRWVLIFWVKVPLKLTDTQCGFKIYHGDIARELYGHCKSDGFLFDVEVIIRALKQGYHIKEFPIEWTSDPDSRLSPIKNLWSTLLELVALKRILKKLN